MKQIPLTKGQVALVDDWWFEYLNQWEWYAMWDPTTRSFYAVRNEGKRPFRKQIKMHRQIKNTSESMLCDHINHNTLDNQENNLRNATRSQSNMNRTTQSNNRLGIKNIRELHNGYQVRVFVGRKNVFSKLYGSIDEAIAARDAAIKKYHGEFAYLKA